MVAVRSFWLAQPGLSGSVSVNHFFAVDHVVSSEYADLVLSLRMFVAELTRARDPRIWVARNRRSPKRRS